jgi:hypothetical protein
MAITEPNCSIFYTQIRETDFIRYPEKGKPSERMGRKTTGLIPRWTGQPGRREVQAPPMVFNRWWIHGGAYVSKKNIRKELEQGILSRLDCCTGSSDNINAGFTNIC